MACDAATLETLIGPTDGLTKLSDHETLMCIANNTNGTSAQTAVNLAFTDGLAKVSFHELLMCLASKYGSGNATTDVATAQSLGLSRLSDLDLWRAFAAVTCR